MATIATVDAIAAIDVREIRWSKLNELIPSTIVLAVGLLMTAWLYVTPAYVPDEVWFRDLAADKLHPSPIMDYGRSSALRTTSSATAPSIGSSTRCWADLLPTRSSPLAGSPLPA